MEDYYEIRISEVDGQMVALFGVYDGMSLSYEINNTINFSIILQILDKSNQDFQLILYMLKMD